MSRLSIYLYDTGAAPIGAVCAAAAGEVGARIALAPNQADVAIAPLLTKILKTDDLAKPRLGTLIFHPSLLPRHRGRDAIKWTLQSKEPYTGVTWFWADAGLDTGDVCVQEIIPVPEGIRPRDFYEQHVIPAAARTLRRALQSLAAGVILRQPQPHTAATYEPPFKKPAATAPDPPAPVRRSPTSAEAWAKEEGKGGSPDPAGVFFIPLIDIRRPITSP